MKFPEPWSLKFSVDAAVRAWYHTIICSPHNTWFSVINHPHLLETGVSLLRGKSYIYLWVCNDKYLEHS